jgi:hypothetical protein
MVNYAQYIPTSLLTTAGDLLIENATPAAARLPVGTAGQVLGVSGGLPAWQTATGGYLCPPVQVAPSSQINYATTSATLAAVTPAATTVAAGSNGGEISQVATWSSPSAGVLDVATTTGWPTAGTFTVATSTTTATCTYTGTAGGNQLTGVAYVSGSATGTVSTGGAVTLTSSAIYTGPFTAPVSGSVVVTVFLEYNGSSSDIVAFGLADHASLTSLRGFVISTDSNSVTNTYAMPLVFLVTGLTTGTSYNFDLLFAIAAAGTLNIRAFGQSTTTPTGANGAPVLVTVQGV